MTDHDHDQSILKNNLAENSDFESRSQFQKRFIQTSQDSILDRDDLLDELDSLSIEDADSDSISSEEVEDNYVEIPSNNISMPDSPKGFQNPLITVANKTSVTSKNSSIQEKPSLQGRSLLNSVITVNSVYIPSSYHTSEHLSDQIRESCEFKSQSKKESLSNSNTSEHQQAIEHSEKSSVSKDSEDYNQEYDSIASQLNKMCLIGEGSEARVYDNLLDNF